MTRFIFPFSFSFFLQPDDKVQCVFWDFQKNGEWSIMLTVGF